VRATLVNSSGGAQSFWTGAWAGVQAVGISLGAVVVTTIATVFAVGRSDGSTVIDWGTASIAGMRLWMLSYGVPFEVDGVVIDLIPLGLTALVAAAFYVCGRRTPISAWGTGVGAGSAAAVVFVTCGVSLGVPASSWALGALTLGFVGGVMAVWSAVRKAGVEFVNTALPPVVGQGVKMGVRAFGLLYALGFVASVVWLVVGWDAVTHATTTLGPGLADSPSLIAMHVVLAPVFVVWMMAWMSGVGFSVGTGSVYSPAELQVEPLPLFPLLGALPSAAGGVLVYAPLVAAGAVLILRIWTGPRSRVDTGALMVSASATVTAAVLAMGAAFLATGSIGAGHLSYAGVDGLAAGLAVGLVVAGGLLLGDAAVAIGKWVRGRPGGELRAHPDASATPLQT